MKKFRVILAGGALLLAFGAALASTVAGPYYEYRVISATNKQCVAHTPPFTCSTTVTPNLCNILVGDDVIRLRENNIVDSQCGPELFKQ